MRAVHAASLAKREFTGPRGLFEGPKGLEQMFGQATAVDWDDPSATRLTAEFLSILRLDKFGPHRPYQFLLNLLVVSPGFFELHLLSPRLNKAKTRHNEEKESSYAQLYRSH
jgi:hypothetical protein